MKKLHVIKAQTLNDVPAKSRGKVLPLLEKEALKWAKKHDKKAFKATEKVQIQFKKNPEKVKKKYFKFLKRLYELKTKSDEDQSYRDNKDAPPLNKKLTEYLDIESIIPTRASIL